MIRLIIIVLLATVSTSVEVLACSCRDAGSFCDFTRTFIPGKMSVMQGQIISIYTLTSDSGWPIPVMDLMVTRHLGGERFRGDTITLIGQDGLNCAMPIERFAANDELIVSLEAINKPDTWGHEFSEYSGHLKTLWGCGSSYLRVVDNNLIDDHITKPSTMTWSTFLDNFSDCTNLQIFGSGLGHLVPNQWNVYPNPTRDRIRIVGIDQPAVYTILSTTGKLMQSGQVEPGSAILLENRTPGLYLVQLKIGPRRLIRRIIVE